MDVTNFWWQAPAGGGGAVIGNSLRFRGAQKLSRTNGPGGNLRTFTQSFWVKRAGTTTDVIFEAWGGATNWSTTAFSTGLLSQNRVSGTTYGINTANVGINYRDPGAWYHVVISYSNAVPTLYINGSEVSTLNNNTSDWHFLRNGYPLTIGARSTNEEFLDGYLSEIHFVDGTALAPTDFGGFNADGVWVPKKVSGVTYGTNGFYLDFSDAADIGADRSGNGNDWTATGFQLTDPTKTDYDWMADSPTDNYATLNPLVLSNNHTFTTASANLDVPNQSSTGNARATPNTFLIPSGGKYYAEKTVGYAGADNDHNTIGLAGFSAWDEFVHDAALNGITGGNYVAYVQVGIIYTGTTNTATVAAWAKGDVLGIAADTTKPQVSFYRNGTLIGTYPLTAEASYFINGSRRGSDAAADSWNFGNRPFAHTPPAGFEPLSTAGMPAVAITNPSDHFQTILGPGPGTGSTTPIAIQYKTTDSADSPTATYQNQVYGKPATDLGATDGVHPVLEWASRLSLAGHSDWYIPAKNELEIIYRNLKPTTDANDTGGGANPNAVPAATGRYTTSNPAQTTVAIFQSGGAEAFASSAEHWTASENNISDAEAWAQWFQTGNPNGIRKSDSGRYGRAIRRVPFTGSEPAIGAAYEGGFFGGLISTDGSGTADYALIVAPKNGGEYGVGTGILDVAQRTFPSGLWWIKDRANSNQHQLVDSVRGGNLAVHLPDRNEQDSPYVAPAGNSVAWCWNLLPDRSNGFDIVTWAGDGDPDRQIAHSLGKKPGFIVTCKRNLTNTDVAVYHQSEGATRGGYLSMDLNFETDTGFWNNTEPTTTEFTVGNNRAMNNGGTNYVGYLWSEIPGYSSIGSYSGASGADGSFIYTGFRIGWLMIKRTNTSSSSWYIFDNQRNTYNPVQHYLRSNLEDPEDASQNLPIDFLSNGFKCRTGSGYIDDAGDSYMYIAFAEHCFGGSNVSPAPAR